MTGSADSDKKILNHISESPDTLLTALDGAEVGVFILGPDFSVQFINETTERYFGLDREAVIGREKQSLIESTIRTVFERPERFAGTVTDTYEDNSYVEEFECHVLAGDGREERWLLHHSHPIESGDLEGGRIEQYTDITQRKERERRLQEQNERLEQFADVVSHDLKNPLNTASLRLELLREESDSEHVELTAQALDRMERIVDDMLWLARQGQDIGTTEPVQLRELLERAWRIATGHDARLVLPEDGELGAIDADVDRLRQLFENLFRNAVEHGSANPDSGDCQDAVEHGGSDVTVRVGTLPDGLYVADDGPGVPDESYDEIFEHGYTTTSGGTGFGLGIVKEIVEAHGWEITVTESGEGGARFEITGMW